MSSAIQTLNDWEQNSSKWSFFRLQCDAYMHNGLYQTTACSCTGNQRDPKNWQEESVAWRHPVDFTVVLQCPSLANGGVQIDPVQDCHAQRHDQELSYKLLRSALLTKIITNKIIE